MKTVRLWFVLIGLATTLRAATITVTTTNDSGPGSLRDAITQANASAGADTIVFNLAAGQQTISVSSNLPQITETLIIDGGNGGVATNRVELSGAGASDTGFFINTTAATNTEVRNLVINGFTSRQILFINTHNGKVHGCFLGVNAAGTAAVPGSGEAIELIGSAGNVIGGTNAAARNVISSLGSNFGGIIVGGIATIQGNHIGLNAAGTARIGSVNVGVFVNNGFALIGGTNSGEGNVIVGNTGILVGGNPALSRSTAIVQGNFIGTDATGMTALNFSGGDGVFCDHSVNCVISNNVISGNGVGIEAHSSGVSGASSFNNTFVDNLIGVAADGVAPLGNRLEGVNIFSTASNVVAGNVIAFNGAAGVSIGFSTNPGNRVLGNSIFSNGGLGIDLLLTGVTTNDLCDADLGSFGAQNFPTITNAVRNSGTVTISGFLDSTPNTNFRLEFFDNIVCEDNGFGEGQFFLGFTNVTTAADCTNRFTVTFNDLGGQYITATATPTDPVGNTSEFSARFPGGPCAPVADCSLAPLLATNAVGELHTVTVTVTSNGVAAGNVNVTFNLTGANGTVQTNITTAGNGQASFSYAGLNTGTDNILAAGAVGATEFSCDAIKVWISQPPSNTPPVAVCQDVTVNAGANCTASVPASAVDNGSSDLDGTIVSRVLNPPGPYPKGVTGVTLTVTDNNGATDTCQATITVVDNTPPTIGACPNVVTNVAAGVTTAVVTFNAPTSGDNCGVESVVSEPPSGSTFGLGTNTVVTTVTDTSGNTNSCSFRVIVQETPPETHDLALIKLKAPKNINLKGAEPSLTKRVKVQIQNLGDHDENITSLAQLANLVTVEVEPLGESECPTPSANLIMGPPNKPKLLKRNQKMNVFFDVTFTCAVDPAKGAGHEDFTYQATVHHDALGTGDDNNPGNDSCPRDGCVAPVTDVFQK